MRSMHMVIVPFLSVFIFIACSHLPCHPPSHYNPESEAPYIAEEVLVITKEGYQLAGTLTIPINKRCSFPAVVLITGSHPQNRDMVSAERTPIDRYRPFRQIADALTRN